MIQFHDLAFGQMQQISQTHLGPIQPHVQRYVGREHELNDCVRRASGFRLWQAEASSWSSTPRKAWSAQRAKIARHVRRRTTRNCDQNLVRSGERPGGPFSFSSVTVSNWVFSGTAQARYASASSRRNKQVDHLQFDFSRLPIGRGKASRLGAKSDPNDREKHRIFHLAAIICSFGGEPAPGRSKRAPPSVHR